MNVLLDSNIYRLDFRMKSPRFRALFDYLRKTRSRLVVPEIVMEEVISNHRREVKKRAAAANDAWQSLGQVIVRKTLTEKVFSDNLDEETSALRQVFANPAKGVSVQMYDSVAGVDVREVYRRGITRTAPARQDGEELRDVILWLIALEYSQQHGEVAFITNDSGFWAADTLQPRLSEDIASRGARLRVYRSLEQFVEEHAPKPEPVTPEWLALYRVDIESDNTLSAQVIQRAILRATPIFRNGQVLRPIGSLKLQFTNGSLYRTSTESAFAALTYSCAVALEVESTTIVDPTDRERVHRLGALAALMRPAPITVRYPVEILGNATIAVYTSAGDLIESEVENFKLEDVRFPDKELTNPESVAAE